jgi:transcription antitermination factor NusB
MKVMQALYGLEQARLAHFQLRMDTLKHAFDPDWNDERSEELNAERAAKAKQAMHIFRENYTNPKWLDTTIEADVRRVVQQNIKEYHDSWENECKGYRNGLLRDVNRLYENYLLLLALPKALADLVEADREMLHKTFMRKDEEKGDYKFRENTIAKFLHNFDAFQVEFKKRSLSWNPHEDALREFYRNVVRPDKTYQQYNLSKLVTFEEEREMVAHIFRHLVFVQQNLIYFSLKEFEIKRYGLEKLAREQSKDTLKQLVVKTACETLKTQARKANVELEQMATWAEDMQKHLADFALHLSKHQEKDKDKEKEREQDKKFKGKRFEKETPAPKIHEGKTEERLFMDNVRQLHALLRESAQVLVGKLTMCLEVTEQNILDKQRTNIDFIEEGLIMLLEPFGLGQEPEDKITLQMENEKTASILQDLFQQIDYNWEENGKVVQNMIMKTLKMFDAPNPSQFSLIELSANWDEDKEFYIDLFNHSLAYEKEAIAQIAQKSQNWEVSRMVGIDRIIMQMAIAEMVHFPSIPVKVTINEYLDMAKVYSTPKSKPFINGMLDQISATMQKEGTIRKSGRGLIDNK